MNNSPNTSIRFLYFGLFLSLLWHFFWGVLLVPVLHPGHYERARGHAVYAGAFLKPADLFPVSSRKSTPAIAFGIPDARIVSRAALDKIEGGDPKPEARFVPARPAPPAAETVTRPLQERGQGDLEALTFGMSDYGRYLYQADFSDLKRAAQREELSRVIVFRVMLDDEGRVVHIEKSSGSGDPTLDLFIQSKISNAVFKPEAAPRGRWFVIDFALR